MSRWLAPLLAAAGVVWASSAQAIGDFSVGQWRGAAVYTNARFTHCGMRFVQKSWSIFVTLNPEGKINLGVGYPGLKFNKGHQIPGSVQIDDQAPVKRTFVAATRLGAGTSMAGVAGFAELSRARRLRVKLGEVAADVQIPQAEAAFARLAQCVQTRGVP